MLWQVIKERRCLLALHVEHDFLDWLRTHTSDHEVTQLDPFRDTNLDQRLQQRWLAALSAASHALRAEIRSAVDPQLPKDPAAREVVAAKLVQRDLARHPWARTLDDLLALVALSKDCQGTIEVIGD